MQKIALLLALLACVGHGRRVHSTTRQARSDGLTERTADADPSAQPVAEASESSHPVSVGSANNKVKTLVMLLTALDPTAQLGQTKVQEGGPTWLSKAMKLFNAEVISALSNVGGQVKSLRRKPFVTTGFLALHVLVHLLQDRVFSAMDYALQPYAVMQKKMFSLQLVLSSFLHHSTETLFFDMCSLFLYGSNFEDLMNWRKVLKLMAFSSIAPNVVHVLASKLWASTTNSPDALAAYQSVSIGSSGTLFCLAQVWRSKVLSRIGHKQSVHGIEVPTQWGSWLEIAIQKLFNPRVSALHQLSGMFAGLVYTHYLPLYKRAKREFRKLSPVQQKAVGVLVAGSLYAGYVLSTKR